jgi:hypothetical protein
MNTFAMRNDGPLPPSLLQLAAANAIKIEPRERRIGSRSYGKIRSTTNQRTPTLVGRRAANDVTCHRTEHVAKHAPLTQS